MKRYLLAFVLCALVVVPVVVHAQGREVFVNPTTHQVATPFDFDVASGYTRGRVSGTIDAKVAATTNLFAVPTTPNPGALPAPRITNATATPTPNPTPPAQRFIVTGIKVETVTSSGVSAGAAITIGSTGTAANSILASTTLSATPANGGYESFTPKAGALVLTSGDMLTATVATPVTGTSQTFKVHVIGYPTT